MKRHHQSRSVVVTSAVCGALFTLTAGSTAHAQRVTVRFPVSPSDSVEFVVHEPEQPAADKLVAGGIVGGLAGFAAGGLLGAVMTRDCRGDDYCQFDAAFLGAAAGGTLGMALGIHSANHSRGNLLIDVVAGAAIWGLGIATAVGSLDSEPVVYGVLIGIPVAQLLTITALERAAAKKPRVPAAE